MVSMIHTRRMVIMMLISRMIAITPAISASGENATGRGEQHDGG